nr:bifunctional aminoglycoside phosphotransferase/ATP-binding protein [Marinobacter bryozoorum]
MIERLQDPAIYDHPAETFQILETHISQVILTGDYAYKIKKPMDFGFLDFSTLEKRRHFCEEEVRLNQRLAPSLYLDVIPLTGSPEQPVLNGTGEPFEYAVRMRQFRQDQLFDGMQERGELTPGLLSELAEQVARFHDSLTPVPGEKPLGTPEAVFAAMQENFDQIRPLLNGDKALEDQLTALEEWTRSTFERQRELIAQRRADGFVRECHGDLHLANITVYEGQVTVFDCIEFSEPFRWIDVINDLAFLLMDLESRREFALASHTLNAYLEWRGDFDGLELLPLYKAYRAMVRAKIALFTRGNPGLSEPVKEGLLQKYRDYANLAEHYTAIPNPYLLATTGLSASGKSTVSHALASELGLIRLRSDVERKRMAGLGPLDSSGSGVGEDLYTEEANRKTYHHLADLSRQLLRAGFGVIVDAACLRENERELLDSVAENLALPFGLIHCEAPEAVRRQWIRARKGDASEADEALLEQQKQWEEPLSEVEKSHTIHIRTDEALAAGELAHRIRGHFGMDSEG